MFCTYNLLGKLQAHIKSRDRTTACRNIPKQTISRQNPWPEIEKIALSLTNPSLWDAALKTAFKIQQIWQQGFKCWELQGKPSCSVASFVKRNQMFIFSWALEGFPFCAFEHPVLLPRCAWALVTSKPLLGISTIAAFSYSWRKGWLLTMNFTYVQTKNALCGFPLAFVSLFCRICFSHQPA